MAILQTRYLSQSFADFDLFSGINVQIPHGGKVGLVGPNGIGKTSLLLILAGQAQPSRGEVHIAKRANVGYLPQEATQAFAGQTQTVYGEMLAVFTPLRQQEQKLRQLEQAMAQGETTADLMAQYSQAQEAFELAGGYDYELEIKQVLTGLGFSESDWSMPLAHLSGGQKTRLLLARLLLEKPDLLILDEPTNHLDVAAIEWLEGMLKGWDGALLIVSHDRYFLDRVVNTIWEMGTAGATGAAGIVTYRGNYSAYLVQREERWQQQEEAYHRLMERLHKEMDYIRRNMAGQRTQMAQGKLSRLAREVEAIHAGGLDVLAQLKSKGWAQVVDEVGLAGRPAATIAELQQRINQLQSPTRPLTLKMSIPQAERSGDQVLRSQDLLVGYPGTPLFEAEDLYLQRGETAALIGPNGTGKSTLLRTILDEIPPLGGRLQLGASLNLAYFSQTHEELDPANTVLDEFLRHYPMLISEARSYLARFLFRGDDVYKQVNSLSGGERSRLALAILLYQGANFLLLDEPTNHLDIPAQEELQAELEQFNGTILLVSHDRYLVDRLATQIWAVADGRLHIYPGTYQEYLVRRAEEKAAIAATAVTPVTAETNGQPENYRGLSKNEQRRLEARIQALEDEVATAERQLAEITEALQAATETQTFDKIQRLSIEYAAAEKALNSLLEEWTQLAQE
jgi:ATP-binding cassette, subfamily F, member 3